MKIVAAGMALAWTLLVFYDVTVAEAPTRKVITHAAYALLSLAAVVLAVVSTPD
jgi:hypothetical protein